MLTRRGGASAGRAPPKPTPRGTPGGRRRRAASLHPRTGRPPAGRASRPRSLRVSSPAAPRESAPSPTRPSRSPRPRARAPRCSALPPSGAAAATGPAGRPHPAPRDPSPGRPLAPAPPTVPRRRPEGSAPRRGRGPGPTGGCRPRAAASHGGSVPTAVSQEETRASVTQFVATSSAVEVLVVESGSSAVTHVPRPQQAVGSAARKTLSGA